METNANNFIDKVINGFKKAAIELEEFQLQLSLGRADAQDTYETLKKEFKTHVHEAKIYFEGVINTAKEKQSQLKPAFEMLQVQLALGKAETLEIYEGQIKKIHTALSQLEIEIQKNESANEYYTKLQLEIEKFKIKLEILKLRYKLNSMESKIEFESKKEEFSKKLADLKEMLIKQTEKAENKWEDFKDEISEAYTNLKKVFVK